MNPKVGDRVVRDKPCSFFCNICKHIIGKVGIVIEESKYECLVEYDGYSHLVNHHKNLLRKINNTSGYSDGF